ncbi:class I SAM-dependent methyltransferase [Deferribacterales bacterium RsTz2092]|nr:methyltransferase [Deferribacterales bacterium]
MSNESGRIDDLSFWEAYYAEYTEPFAPSLFAKYILEHFAKQGSTLIELGCGNGRDAVFFADNGIKVTAIDQCAGEIEYLNKHLQNEFLKFYCTDFTSLSVEHRFDVVYSRFTLHSVAEEQEDEVIKWSFDCLNAGGYLCIEARGLNNELYKKGEPVADKHNTYIYEGHSRRFIDLAKMKEKLNNIGFEVVFAQEQKGFAPHNGEDETFMRLIAKNVADVPRRS